MKTSEKRNTLFEELHGTTSEIIDQIKKLIRKGNTRRLMIQNKKGKILFQTQLTAGLTGTALLTFISPITAALSFFALVLTDIKVVVEKYPEDELDEDEYEVQAEVIEIKEDEEKDEKEESDTEDKEVDKTVGKDKK